MEEVTQGSNGKMNYISGQGGGLIIDSLPLRYVGDTFYTSAYVDELKAEIENLKNELLTLQTKKEVFNELKKPFDKVSYEINRLEEDNKNLNILLDDISKVNSKLEEQNNTNYDSLTEWAINYQKDEVDRLNKLLDRFLESNDKLKEENKKLKDLNSKLFNKNKDLEVKIKDSEDYFNKLQYTGYRINEIKELTEQLEVKETINQDLVKKYQTLQEEIDAYDINMSEMVKKYEQLEQEDNCKKYQQHIYIGEKILDIINKVNCESYSIVLSIKDRLISSVELNKFNQELYQQSLERIKQLEQDYKDISKNVLQGLQVKLQHRVKPYLNAGVVNVIIETKEEFK